MKPTILLLFGLLVAGCSDSTTNEPLHERPAGISTYGYAPEGADIPDLRAMSQEERDAYGAETIAMQQGVYHATTQSASWEEAHERVQEVLAQRERVPAYRTEQVAAQSMLERHLLSAPDSPEVTETILLYTTMMVDHETPNAGLIERALVRLDGAQPDAEVRDLAAQTVASARSYVARRAACEGCAQDKRALNEVVAESADAALAETIDAAERLERRFVR